MRSLGLLFAVLSVWAVADTDTLPVFATSPARSTAATSSGMLKFGPVGKPPAQSASPTPKGDGEGPGIPFIAAIEAYGSARINEAVIRKTLGSRLDTWLAKGLKGDPSSTAMERELADVFKKKFGFVLAEWSILQYFEPENQKGMPIYITLDVVEAEEAKARMPFLPQPIGVYPDPDFLIKEWLDYEKQAIQLVEDGAIEPETNACAAFHCPFGHKHAKLKKYEKIFVDGVKKNLPALLEIQAHDRREEFRAASSYLIPYAKDGNQVVSAEIGRIKDPSPLVRNNALRVLGDVAEFHPEIIIPGKPIIQALDYPRVSDRAKALYALYLSALSSQQVRDEILKTSVPRLIDLMTSKQPDHRELSHSILRKISGKEFAATDIQAWDDWYSRLSLNRAISKAPR